MQMSLPYVETSASILFVFIVFYALSFLRRSSLFCRRHFKLLAIFDEAIDRPAGRALTDRQTDAGK